MTSALVVAPAWPPELPPVRLVRTLVSSGTRVTVAAEARGRKAFEGAGAEVLVLPRSGSPGAGAVMALGSSGVRAARSSRSRSALASVVIERSGRDRLEALWRLLPLATSSWDELYLPATREALAYLPAVRLASRAVVVVDRPPGAEVTGLLTAATEVRCSSASLAQAASDRGAPPGTVRVSPDPLPDPDVFRPGDPRPPARLRLVCTAPFHWSGGHDYLLVALRQLVDGGLDLTCDLVDDSPEPQRLLYTVADLGLSRMGPDGRPHGDVVTVHRRPSLLETADLLRRADVFVLAAVEDRPWPEAAEARAVGLPVVASELPELARSVGDGPVSLVAPRDPEALASAVSAVAARRGEGPS